jgi:hypothetical protein
LIYDCNTKTQQDTLPLRQSLQNITRSIQLLLI